jgi:thioredoxin-dependent peroxiredoxin
LTSPGAPAKVEPDQEGDRPGGRRPRRGDRAPDFSLVGTGGVTYSLREHAGDPVVLVFYPADHSPVCTLQLRSYSEDLNAFESLGATVLCLSPQDLASHEEFSRINELRVPLLADTDATVGEAYDILGPLGFYRRSVFVIDGEGIIRFARRSLSSMTYVPTEQLVEAVRSAVA